LILFGIIKLTFVFVGNFLNVTFENTEIMKKNNIIGNKYIEIKY